jgi:hypothetical protein
VVEVWVGRKRENGRYSLRLKGGDVDFKVSGVPCGRIYDIILEVEVLGYFDQAAELRDVMKRFENCPVGQPVPGMEALPDGHWVWTGGKG